jgi:hypothetical protein
VVLYHVASNAQISGHCSFLCVIASPRAFFNASWHLGEAANMEHAL